MMLAKTFGSIGAVAAAAFLVAAGPASARPVHHPRTKTVCKWERHHGHKVRVCHKVRVHR